MRDTLEFNQNLKSSYRRNIGLSNRINMKPSHRSSKEFVPAQEGDMTNLGDSTTDVQVERRALVKKRNLTRSKITMLCNLMNDLVESRGSSMMLREQHQELEDLRKECKPLEQKLTDIYAETEDEETWDKEMKSQTEYSKKISSTRTRTEEYLKERLGEPPCACADFQPIPEKLVIDEHIKMVGSALEKQTRLPLYPHRPAAEAEPVKNPFTAPEEETETPPNSPTSPSVSKLSYMTLLGQISNAYCTCVCYWH